MLIHVVQYYICISLKEGISDFITEFFSKPQLYTFQKFYIFKSYYLLRINCAVSDTTFSEKGSNGFIRKCFKTNDQDTPTLIAIIVLRKY